MSTSHGPIHKTLCTFLYVLSLPSIQTSCRECKSNFNIIIEPCNLYVTSYPRCERSSQAWHRESPGDCDGDSSLTVVER